MTCCIDGTIRRSTTRSLRSLRVNLPVQGDNRRACETHRFASAGEPEMAAVRYN
jgi:hypothetical protein